MNPAPRFRRLRTSVFVAYPDGESGRKEVELIFDEARQAVGVMLIGDTPLRGTVILVDEAAIAEVKARGTPSHKLTVEA